MSIDCRKYEEYKALIEEHILDYLPIMDERSGDLLEAMSYSLLAGGKRMRPAFLMAAYELTGGHAQNALPFACAVEYIQTYSLIHDDLPGMDNDDYRRGKLTNHKVFGEGMAILAGDGLLSCAHELMEKEVFLSVDDPEIMKYKALAAYTIAEGTGCRGMVAGQAADLTAEKNKSKKPDVLSYIHKNKTAAFIKASILGGAYLGGAGEGVLDDLENYANSFGLAFQIVDDIQDVIGTKEERGKDVGGDAESDKLTYPSVYGLDESRRLAADNLETARRSVQKYGDKAELFLAFIKYLEEHLK